MRETEGDVDEGIRTTVHKESLAESQPPQARPPQADERREIRQQQAGACTYGPHGQGRDETPAEGERIARGKGVVDSVTDGSQATYHTCDDGGNDGEADEKRKAHHR